jgi:hypothetical protein
MQSRTGPSARALQDAQLAYGMPRSSVCPGEQEALAWRPFFELMSLEAPEDSSTYDGCNSIQTVFRTLEPTVACRLPYLPKFLGTFPC